MNPLDNIQAHAMAPNLLFILHFWAPFLLLKGVSPASSWTLDELLSLLSPSFILFCSQELKNTRFAHGYGLLAYYSSWHVEVQMSIYILKENQKNYVSP